MYKGARPRIIPLIIAIVVVALIIAALVSLGRMLLAGNSSTTSTQQASQSDQIRTDVLDTAEGRAVRFTERGSIVANENFKSYQIYITPTTRTYTTYKGYLDEVVSTKQYSNSARGYEEFVYALDKANISQTNSSQADDVRGVCATNGRVYLFETVNNGTATHTLWTSTCSQSKGTMGADVAKIRALFVNQIPEFDAKYLTPVQSAATLF